MITRFKLIAAALGLVLATGAAADASAKTVDQTVAKKTVIARHVGVHHVASHRVATSKIFKSRKIVVRTHPRLHVGTRIVKHVRIVHGAPLATRLVGTAPYKAHRVLAYPLSRTHGFYRTHLGSRIVKHVRTVKTTNLKTRVAKHVTSKKIVQNGKAKASLPQHAMNHRAGQDDRSLRSSPYKNRAGAAARRTRPEAKLALPCRFWLVSHALVARAL